MCYFLGQTGRFLNDRGDHEHHISTIDDIGQGENPRAGP